MKRAILVLGAMGVLAATPVVAADGKAVYENSCGGCHAMMAPKLGDKAAFEPLIKQGIGCGHRIGDQGQGHDAAQGRGGVRRRSQGCSRVHVQ